ncbi:MAG: hypothetical protein ACI85F_002524 [Bacteroidia bacterium]|jgi:hypothetical protein
MKHILLSIIAIASFSSYAQTHVVLQTNNLFGSQAFYADNQEHDYLDWNDNEIKFSRVSYYLAQLELSDGSASEALSESHVLVKSDITEYYLGTTTLSTISSINFGLGIEASLNHLDPATYPGNSPLAHQTPNMHWGWSAGYKFVVLEGYVDDSGNGTPSDIFQFHCLDDANYQAGIDVPTYTTSSNDTLYIKITVDHKGWIEQVDVPDAGVLHGSFPETNQVMDNSSGSPVFRAYSAVGIEEDQKHSYAVVDYLKPYAPTIRYSFDGIRKVDVRIMDMNGKVIESGNSLNGQGEFAIWSEPATGIYLYSFSSNGEVLATERFTVTR